MAKKVGLKTYNELVSEAERTAAEKIKQSDKQQITNQVLLRILSEHDFEVPVWHILMESQKFAAQQGVRWDSLTDQQIDNINKQSKDKVKLSLIFDAIRDNEPEASFSDQEMINNIRGQLETAGQNVEKTLSRMTKDGSLVGMVAALKDAALTEWLIKQSEIVE